MTTPGPWEVWNDPAGFGAYLIVGPENDQGARHTVARISPCLDGPHPGRGLHDASLIVYAVNKLIQDES